MGGWMVTQLCVPSRNDDISGASTWYDLSGFIFYT